MKQIFTLITLVLVTVAAVAQPYETNRRPQYNQQGKLSISTIANESTRVTVDGNSYNSKEKDDVILINDIRPGYHAIKVYSQKKSKSKGWGKNRNMQLIYEGNVYVKPQYHVDIVINRFGKALVDERHMNAGYYNDNDDDHGGWGQYDNDRHEPMNGRSFEQFKQTIRNENYDNARVAVAKTTIANNYFSAAQVREMIQLFNFENSKLDVAKYSYRYTVDKNNFFVVNDAFSYSSSKEELARYIQAYR